MSVVGKLKAVAMNTAIVAIALITAACLAELLVRLVAPQQLVVMRPDIWMPDDSLGWRVRGGVDAWINTGERDVEFASDSAGFRAPLHRPHVRGDENVLLIGDSFMQALQVGYDSTTGSILERDLSNALGRSVSVWNAGVDGWDPDQYLIRVRQLLARAPYDAAVITIYVDNDVIAKWRKRVPPRQNAEQHRFHVPRGLSHAALVGAVFYPLNDVLKRHSHLFQLVKHGFDTLLLRAGLAATDPPTVVQRSMASAPMWDVTTRICVDIAAAGAAHHVPVVFAIIPASYQVDSAAFAYYVRGFKLDPAKLDADQPQRILDQSLISRGLTVVDVLPTFRARQRLGKPLYGHVDRHLSPLGHEILASQIKQPLQLALQSRGVVH
jgi:hypothetical protein